ncbi:MAG TPA: hypothetical protein VGG21_05555 [Acidimicrobiales bacterium]
MSIVYPELASGRFDDAGGAWTILEGTTFRGGASCNLRDRILEVPLESSDVARVVRAHELMHARVSPHAEVLVRALDDVSARALECAEELRVNTLIARLGFDVSLLRDGTEKPGVSALAESGRWDEVLYFLAAVLGTGAERDLFGAVRRARPTWLAALRAVRKRALQIVSLEAGAMGDTRLDDEGLPRGYVASTLVLARLLSQCAGARIPQGAEELRAFRRSLEAGGRRPASGRFAPLVFDASPVSIRTRGPRSSKRRASVCGPVLSYPGRLLTDERRRAFAQRRRERGGVVVIDQSGSMDVSEEELRALLRTAPEALVVGYSHRPGDPGVTANAWVLCNRGVVAEHCPTGNIGNGVDGPVLAWAAAQRRAKEPFVWVTDGQVTDSHDYPDLALTKECATLVRRHRIQLVRELGDLDRALRVPSSRSAWAAFGRVGRELGDHHGAGLACYTG